MNKRTFLVTLSFIGGLNRAVVAADKDIKNHSYLSPENCSLGDPDSRYLERSEKFRAEFGDCEQSLDRFCEAYAENLEKWIAKKYPKSKASRELIENAYFEAMNFIIFDVNGGMIHVLTRFPATMKWILWRGYDKNFDTLEAEAKYSLDDIRVLLKMLSKAQGESNGHSNVSSNRIDECINSLRKCEPQLSENARAYFRSNLVKLIAQWL